MIRNGFAARSIGSALLVFAVVHAALGATEYTASTLEELTNALNSASRASGEAVVTIAEGTYDLTEMAKMHSSAKLSVSNGVWGRKMTIQGDPAKTRESVVLDAGRASRVLRVFGWSGSKTAAWQQRTGAGSISRTAHSRGTRRQAVRPPPEAQATGISPTASFAGTFAVAVLEAAALSTTREALSVARSSRTAHTATRSRVRLSMPRAR